MTAPRAVNIYEFRWVCPACSFIYGSIMPVSTTGLTCPACSTYDAPQLDVFHNAYLAANKNYELRAYITGNWFQALEHKKSDRYGKRDPSYSALNFSPQLLYTFQRETDSDLPVITRSDNSRGVIGMAVKRERTEVMAVRLTPEMLAKLDAVCDKHGLGRRELVEKIILVISSEESVNLSTCEPLR